MLICKYIDKRSSRISWDSEEAVIHARCEDADRYYSLLYRDHNQANGITPSQLATSNKILVNQSDTSIVETRIFATQCLQTQSLLNH